MKKSRIFLKKFIKYDTVEDFVIAISLFMCYNAGTEQTETEKFDMKRIIAALCVFLTLAQTALADEDITVLLNGNAVEFDRSPIIYNDRTLVPMRAIFESFGLMVQWFEDEQRITAFDENTSITMFIGDNQIHLNDKTFESDVAPMIIDGRTFVPLRVIGESLNGNVEWYGDTRTVTIDIEGNINDVSDKELERKILYLTNVEREKNGLKRLIWNEELADVARAHSKDMAERGFFSHDNPDGQTPFDRIKAAGMKYLVAAENIAGGQASPEKAVEEWMNSEGHRKNILNPGLKELGVGLARGGKYGIYWTQNFATFK